MFHYKYTNFPPACSILRGHEIRSNKYGRVRRSIKGDRHAEHWPFCDLYRWHLNLWHGLNDDEY